MEHAKRYEDIADVLDAGIDVFSTLNVQHLESLNDRVAELTGVRVRETVPDAVLGTADEIVMIDLTPEALLLRLRAGKVYPAERVPAALNGFFKIENLAALREVALRQVAENVETRRLTTEVVGTRDESVAHRAPAAVAERLLALVQPQPSSQRLVRRAFRSAQRLGADLDLVWVKRPGAVPDEESERGLRALGQLASVLGATLLVEESDDIVEAVSRVVAQRGTTYLFMGRPRRGTRARAPAPPAPAAADRPHPGRRHPRRRRPLAAQRRGRAVTLGLAVGRLRARGCALALGVALGRRAVRSGPRGRRRAGRSRRPSTGSSCRSPA